jgi:predicted transcriptional regulator
MGSSTVDRVALMAIHPIYADAILSGRKKVEFRKRALAPEVTVVAVYATHPVQAVVGEFTISEIKVDSPAKLWLALSGIGGIDRASFNDYYQGRQRGVGLLVGEARRYERAVKLADLDPSPAIPQSYAYVSRSVLWQLRDHQAAQHFEAVHRFYRPAERGYALVPHAPRQPGSVVRSAAP